jgi:ethanolamine ammonia-lyase small subunit
MSVPVLWRDLRRFTPARVALGRVGNGLPTDAQLAFQAAHAAARDAVQAVLDIPALQADLRQVGLAASVVHSACPDRRTFLLRPDLGRRLRDTAGLPLAPGCLAILLCDGLSAAAVQRHAPPLLGHLAGRLERMGPIAIAVQGRVALGDEVGDAVGAEAILVLIGERPGQTAPDSLGAYLTWQPKRGCTDAERNCVSNIRPDGLPTAAAADKLLWLIMRMRALRLSGVGLKDEQPAISQAGLDQGRSIPAVGP